MLTCIREVRRAKGFTLAEVGARCRPPTTAQTIGRLETGTRTVSVGWLNRIAGALDVEAADLVTLPEREDIAIVAVLGADGAHAPRHAGVALAPRPTPGLVALRVEAGSGDYRAGDELWLERLAPPDYARALNRDLLVPRPAGRFALGRLIGRDPGKLHLLPHGPGARQMVVADPPWAGMAVKLIRSL